MSRYGRWIADYKEPDENGNDVVLGFWFAGGSLETPPALRTPEHARAIAAEALAWADTREGK